jgi:hypothetical protein
VTLRHLDLFAGIGGFSLGLKTEKDRQMSFEASAWAARQTAGSPEAKLVLLLLGDISGPLCDCWPDPDRLAARAEMSTAHLKAILRDLAARKMIFHVDGARLMVVLPINKKMIDIVGDPRLEQEFFADEFSWRDAMRRAGIEC